MCNRNSNSEVQVQGKEKLRLHFEGFCLRFYFVVDGRPLSWLVLRSRSSNTDKRLIVSIRSDYRYYRNTVAKYRNQQPIPLILSSRNF